MKINSLFVTPIIIKEPKLRLFCFPFAGGSINTYLPWKDHFKTEIELVLVQSPGRGARIQEPPFTNMNDLVGELLEESEYFTRSPYMIFGHSLGARIGYELIRQLEKARERLPLHYIASASPSPHLLKTVDRISDKSDEDFIKAIDGFNGTPKEVIENQDLMKILLPLLRADFGIAENYRSDNVGLLCPITVFHGAEDRGIEQDAIQAWRALSRNSITFEEIPGGHFFINEHRETVIHSVLKIGRSLIKESQPITELS